MEYKINYSYDSLMHYGVKGMKWGKVGAMAKAEEDMIRTSRDAGRAQSREVANKVNLPKFENEWKSASSALVRYAGKTHRPDKSGTGKYSSQDIDNYFNALNREDDAWKKYNDLRWRNIDGTDSRDSYNSENTARRAEAYATLLKKQSNQKASEYESNRNSTNKKQTLDAAQVKASKDVGRAQSKIASANSQYKMGNGTSVVTKYDSNGNDVTPSGYQKATDAAMNASASARIKLANVNEKLDSYNAKTKKNIDKITKGAKTVSQIATNASAKASNFVSSLFGKKKGR